MTPDEPSADWVDDGGRLRLRLGGDWITASLDRAGWTWSMPARLAGRHVVVEFDDMGRLDSNAVLTLRSWFAAIERESASMELLYPPEHFRTISRLLDEQAQASASPRRPGIGDYMEDLGRATMQAFAIALDLVAFLGEMTVSLAKALARPAQLRGTSMVHHMQQAGVAALPIVGLLSFLIGVVTAYQGADQLARFGAEIFTVNVVGIGVLREMGPLIAAIVVAGRSASAFAAQIGTMKINEEIDALRVIGIEPMAALVIPRTLALIIIFPFLVVFANAMGILGGAIMATVALDITFSQFAAQFQAGVPLNSFWLGMVKAPMFAAAIGGIGCYQGLQVGGGAASVGERTTAAVVQAIFLVIVIDAIMSIVYSVMGL